MAYNNSQNSLAETLKKELEDLIFYFENYMACDTFEGFTKGRDNIINLFKGRSGIEAISLIDSLDFNTNDNYILHFLPDIVKNMRLADQLIFVEHIKSLQERYPDVNLGPSLFYAGLNYNFGDLSSNGNSTDSFDAGSNVHFFK